MYPVNIENLEECVDGFYPHPTSSEATIVVKTSALRSKNAFMFPHPPGEMLEAFNAWMNGAMIQDAFSFCDADERELLLTGITPTQWTDLYGQEDEED